MNTIPPLIFTLPRPLPEKTMLLACSNRHALGFTRLIHLAKRHFSVVLCRTGTEAVSTALVQEPDVFLVYGYVLQDMDAVDLMYKVREAFPHRKMRLVCMHNGYFDDYLGDENIRLNSGGYDVNMPRETPLSFIGPIFEKLKEPYPTPPPTEGH